MGVIYKIMNPKGKMYVGKTYNLKHRIASHKCAAKAGRNIILHNSIRKYGWDQHLLSVIEEVPEALLNEREMFWIHTLKTYCYENPMGMNMSIGGDGNRTPWMHNLERRNAASKQFSGIQNPFFGKKHTDETKRIIGEKAYKRNIESGRRVPDWGAAKGIEKSSVAVVAYNSAGEFISEFKSLSIAAAYFKIDRKLVTAVLVKRQTNAFGWVFRYKTSGTNPLIIDVSHLKKKSVAKPIILVDVAMNIIKEYLSSSQAAADLCIPQSNILRAVKNYNGRPIRTGQRFLYKEQYELLQRN